MDDTNAKQPFRFGMMANPNRAAPKVTSAIHKRYAKSVT